MENDDRLPWDQFYEDHGRNNNQVGIAFEELCRSIFKRDGLEFSSTGGGGHDKGRDLEATLSYTDDGNAQAAEVWVECKYR